MIKMQRIGFFLKTTIFIILCINIFSCSDKYHITDPEDYDDKWPYQNDLNASWSSDHDLLIYYNASHSDNYGSITDSTFGVHIKDFITDSTAIWSDDLMIGGGGLSLSPDNQWLIFEAVYSIHKIPFELPLNLEQMETIGNETGPNLYPKWSRDGNLIALDIRLGDPGIYIMKPDGSDKHKVGPWGGKYPFFSFDNEYIYCSAYQDSVGNEEIFKVDFEENTYIQLTFFDEFDHIHYILPSIDENILIFSAKHIDDWGTHIYRYDIDTGQLIQLIDKYAEAWDWNYENDTILYTYCPSNEQGDINGYLWTMKPDGSEKVQITFIE
jgi:Tol biopolymer transport system component